LTSEENGAKETMPEPTDMIMPMLGEMRDETRQGFDDLTLR
jgi:hypothetical protein